MDSSNSTEDSTQFLGSRVSIEISGNLGNFEGTVVGVNGTTQSLTIANVIHNGKATSISDVQFDAKDIVKLDMLSIPEEDLLDSDASIILEEEVISAPIAEVQQMKIMCNLPEASIDNGNNDEITDSEIDDNNQLIIAHDSKEEVEETDVIRAFMKANQNFPQIGMPASINILPFQNTPAKQTKTQGVRLQEQSSITPTNISFEPVPVSLVEKSNSSITGGHVKKDQSTLKQAFAQIHPVQEVHPQSRQEARKKNKEIQRSKNANTFGHEFLDTNFNEDFDFESNLKLFDKKAFAAEVDQQRLQHHHQPDVVIQTTKQRPYLADDNAQTTNNITQEKYRCDENVLSATESSEDHIMLPADEVTEVVYATDNGFIVPGLPVTLRNKLLSVATQRGFTVTRQLEVTGRAAAELCLQLLGGDHRLHSGNSHQVPHVVVLCGAHHQGALGLNTARQLHTHDVITTVITPALGSSSAASLQYKNELQLSELSGGALVHSVTQMKPQATIDMILDARMDHEGNSGTGGVEWLSCVTSWALRHRCPVVSLDPPGHACAQRHLLAARALVVGGLPLVYNERQGLVHLVKMAIPYKLYSEVGITYKSPFRAKFMVSLHPCD